MNPSFGTIAFGVVGIAAIAMAFIGPPDARGQSQLAEGRAEAPAPVAAAPSAPATSALAKVAAAGITLASVGVTLPTSDRPYPDGPHADTINGNCLSCHSAGMVLTQPAMTRADWQGEVNKMVKVYKAPIEPADMTLIVDYLAALKPGG